MKTAGKIGIAAAMLAIIGTGLAVYDDEEKKKCAAGNGTWQGLFKSPKCVNVVPVPAPTSPTNVQVSQITATGADSWTAAATWNAVTGATSYQPMLDGQPYGQPVTGTSVQLKGSGVNQTHTFSVDACN